jgi:type I restriction enzyme S subunit
MEKNTTSGWEWVKLKDISDTIQYGYTESSSKENVGPKFLRITDIQDSKVIWADVPYCKISNELKNKYLLREGDLVFARTGATVGKSYLIKGEIPETVFASYLIRVRVNKQINENYLSYFFNSTIYWTQITEGQVGIGQPNVNGTKLGQLNLPLAPLDQQGQIVDKIEELFSELDKGVENLKTAQQQLKVYRQAVLKSAFNGMLTHTSLKKDELPKTWKLMSFGEVTNNFDGKRRPLSAKVRESFKGQYPYYGACDIIDYVKDFLLDGKYILIGEDGANLLSKNKPLAFIVNGKFWVNNHAHVCQPKDFILFEFLNYQFNSIHINQYISGTAQPKLNQANLNKIPIIVPPLDDQLRVIQEIESRLSVCDKIEETITDSLQQAEVLRQSILKKAFEGKLVTANTQKEAKVVSINSMRGVWERKVLAGKIIFACHKERSFGTTKFQKLLYLCEQHAQLEFDTHYVKQTAGPLDAAFIYPFIREAEKNGWFVQETEIAPFHFEPLNGLGKLTGDYPKFFQLVSDKINFVIALMKEKNTDDSELVATIYAIWNNYIIQQRVLDAEILIDEIYDWSKSKAKFSKQGILAMWKWMKEVGLVPVGFGDLIEK